MEGFEAISKYNGWAMAIVGATIVFLGLVVLSFSISQIHKFLMFWDDRGVHFQRLRNFRVWNRKKSKNRYLGKTESLLEDIHKTAQLYEPLILQLGKSFQMVDLYNLFYEKNFPHPHLTITKFRENKILIPDGDGAFKWNPQQSFKK